MAWLILDLDLTVWTTDDDAELLDQNTHTLSNPGTVKLGSTRLPVRIINVDKLAELINYACDECQGVIILTAGDWDTQDTLNYLCLSLTELSPKAWGMLSQAPVITVENSSYLYPDIPLQTIRTYPKAERLQTWLRHSGQTLCREYDNFVVVDDNVEHIRSFQSFFNHQNVFAVHATTRLEDIQKEQLDAAALFYKTARTILSIYTILERQAKAAGYLSVTQHGFFKATAPPQEETDAVAEPSTLASSSSSN